MQADRKAMYYMMPATYTHIHLLFYTNDIDLLGPEKHMITQVMSLHVFSLPVSLYQAID